jgi:hypothetical protein
VVLAKDLRQRPLPFAPLFAPAREIPNNLTRSPLLQRRCSGCRQKTGLGSPPCCSASKKGSDKAMSYADNPWQDCGLLALGSLTPHSDRLMRPRVVVATWKRLSCILRGLRGTGKDLAHHGAN